MTPLIEQRLARQRERRQHDRLTLLEMLGPFCRFCGESDEAYLEVDHVLPIGQEYWGQATYHRCLDQVLQGLKNGRVSPFEIQVLCGNHHNGKTRMEQLEKRRLP